MQDLAIAAATKLLPPWLVQGWSVRRTISQPSVKANKRTPNTKGFDRAEYRKRHREAQSTHCRPQKRKELRFKQRSLKQVQPMPSNMPRPLNILTIPLHTQIRIKHIRQERRDLVQQSPFGTWKVVRFYRNSDGGRALCGRSWPDGTVPCKPRARMSKPSPKYADGEEKGDIHWGKP